MSPIESAINTVAITFKKSRRGKTTRWRKGNARESISSSPFLIPAHANLPWNQTHTVNSMHQKEHTHGDFQNCVKIRVQQLKKKKRQHLYYLPRSFAPLIVPRPFAPFFCLALSASAIDLVICPAL